MPKKEGSKQLKGQGIMWGIFTHKDIHITLTYDKVEKYLKDYGIK